MLFLELGQLLKFFDEKYLDYFNFSFLTQGNIVDEMNNLFYSLLIFLRGYPATDLCLYTYFICIKTLKTFN